jgi:hypothetical protein
MRTISTAPSLGLAAAWAVPATTAPGGRLSIDGIALAASTPGGPVGAVDLDDLVSLVVQGARQAGAVTAGALHPERPDRAGCQCPPAQLHVAPELWSGW